MKKLIILTVFLATLSLSAFSQKDVDFSGSPKFLDRVYFGGGLGLSVGSDQTYVSLSPVVGYMITQQWSAGIGINYEYLNNKNYDYTDNLWGGNLFTRYNIQQFFLQAQYNLINYGVIGYNQTTREYEAVERDVATRLLLGGGISQPLGKKGKLNMMALYDVTYDNLDPYDSPWVFKVYFTF